jgi:glycosyltransferase involved in cell wall biosynthesis
LIGRGVFATNLLLLVKGKKNTVVYDGRGAIWAEAEEYQVYQGVLSNQTIFELEKNAVLASDKKIAVSNKLVEYWQQEFAYDQDTHTVIPCSYSPADKTPSQNLKSTVGWNSEDVVFIYSGSLEGWQGLGELGEIFKDLLSLNPKCKLLLLARKSAISIELEKQYPNQVKRKWLAPEEVSSYLSMGDYGLLLRPESVTNKVASPVKFAEYVGAGLKVLISPNIGDFSGFTKENNLGYIIKLPSEISEVEISSNLDKDRISALADQEFSKENSVIVSKYLSLVN